MSEDKLRILHIAEAPGGVERYLVTLLTKLKKNYNDKFEHVLVCSDSFDIKKFTDLVLEIEHVEYMHNVISIKDDLRSIGVVRKLIKKHKPDIVYCHSSKAGAIGRIANIGLKNRCGKKNVCIYNAHGWSFNIKGADNKKIKTYIAIEKMLAPLADCIICISDFEKKSALVNHICKEDKLQIIYNGIDFDEYKDINGISSNNINIPKDAYVVGMVGRLARQKASDVFVKAAVEIKKRVDNAFFIIVGDGMERTKIENLIQEYGLKGSFLITGWVDNPLDYVECFDIAMLLSRWEGFGLVLPEYMIIGKPIVATKVDAIPEIVEDGVTGLLVKSEDYRQAAEYVIKIKEDNELRFRLIENGKRIVKNRFNVDRTAYEHEELFARFYKETFKTY